MGDLLTRAEYLLFEDLVSEASGFRMGNGGESAALRAALCERVQVARCSGFGEYYELLKSPTGGAELTRLIELITVHETAFFRTRSHFDALVRTIVPELVNKNAASRTMRFWSAGCSTGQEAYSIAISLLESVPALETWRVEVLATDISLRALESARAATYSERALRNVEAPLLDRYFERMPEGYRVAERVRRLVRFEQINLVKEPFPMAAVSPCDVVFCENVTIYFKVDSTRRVIRNFHDALREGGYLFLGYSETLWQISEDFTLREIDGSFVYQKRPHGVGVRDAVKPLATRAPAASGKADRARPTPLPYRPRTTTPPALPPRKIATLDEAAALYEAGRFAEALVAVESVLLASPTDSGAHLLAAKLRADREELGPALIHCRRALEADPLLEEGHYLMGVLQLRIGESREAIQSLSRVIYLNPGGQRSAISHFLLAGAHADAGNWAWATREYRNALRLLQRFPTDELVGEFSADFLARVCRRRLEELERGA